MSTIAIQGAVGSFHSEAAAHLSPHASQVNCMSFQEVFDKVSSGEVARGVVAIENSLHGSITQVYRLLERNDFWIAGEVTLCIEQYLIGTPASSLEGITRVSSQAPALSQCELWLNTHLPHASRMETHDTADSVRIVVADGDAHHAAIAGKHAARIYGGKIVAGPINDDANNYTRFVLLQKEHKEPADADRTSIILTLRNTPGALYDTLGIFVEEGVNLSKIDSHPIPCDTRNYSFYIDFDTALSSPAAQRILKKLADKGHTARILGSYKADHSIAMACKL